MHNVNIKFIVSILIILYVYIDFIYYSSFFVLSGINSSNAIFENSHYILKTSLYSNRLHRFKSAMITSPTDMKA